MIPKYFGLNTAGGLEMQDLQTYKENATAMCALSQGSSLPLEAIFFLCASICAISKKVHLSRQRR